MHFLLALAPTLGYTPPGILAALVDNKRREVERLKKLPEAREDGPWYLRMTYPADESSYTVGRALGWRRERPAVIIDLKRTSPTGQLGVTRPVAPDLVVSAALARASQLGVDGAMVCTDLTSYGGSLSEMKDVSRAARVPPLARGGEPFPVIAKDLFIDPLQIARAACEGARAVVLIAAAVLPDLPALLDTCTLLGLEAIVEVHTADEIAVAAGCNAGILLVNERDRASGELIVGQAASVAPLMPPDTVCLACGGISRIDQVRTLRQAGYDGFVIGRALAGDPRSTEALMSAIAAEPPRQRWAEPISIPQRSLANGPGDEDKGGLPLWEPDAKSIDEALADDYGI